MMTKTKLKWKFRESKDEQVEDHMWESDSRLHVQTSIEKTEHNVVAHLKDGKFLFFSENFRSAKKAKEFAQEKFDEDPTRFSL